MSLSKKFAAARQVMQLYVDGHDEQSILYEMYQSEETAEFADIQFIRNSYVFLAPNAANLAQAAIICFASKDVDYRPHPKDYEGFNFLALSGLSRDERELVHQRGLGKTRREIADILDIKSESVRHKTRKIYHKLKVTDWTDEEKVKYLKHLGRWGTPDLPAQSIMARLNSAYANYFEHISSDECEFGDLMSHFRRECRPRLTQKGLSELMSEECDFYISQKRIGNYECGVPPAIPKDDRQMLCVLISIFFKRGGIQCLSDANRLLHLGNYRSLNTDEINRINPDWYWQLPGVI